jgi:2-dehydro-3-deoxyphosphogalactonate aldolase
MNKLQMSQALEQCPVVAILRGITPDSVVETCQALADGGISLIEITMNSPDALKSIKLAVEHFAGSKVNIGAGTVLSVQEVDAVAGAGGQYIISPNCNPEVIKRTKELGLLSLPGIFTPSEAFTALQSGADFLKLFPAGRLAPEYIKDLKAVVPADFIAVGGVGVGNIKDYLQYAVGAGIGSAVYKAGWSIEQITMAAKRLIDGLK